MNTQNIGSLETKNRRFLDMAESINNLLAHNYLNKYRLSVKYIVLILFTFYIAGAHLRLSITYGGSTIVPLYFMLASASFLFLCISNEILKYSGLSFLILILFLFAHLFFSYGSINLNSQISSNLLLAASVFACLVFIVGLQKVEPSSLRKLALYIWFSLILIATIEQYFLKEQFDYARQILYSDSGRFVYFSDARDLQIYGKIRATALASEPSFLADTLSSLTLMVFFLDSNTRRLKPFINLAAMLCINFFFSPSFKMAFYVLALIIWLTWPTSVSRIKKITVFLSIFLTITTLLTAPILPLIFEYFGTHMDSGSFFGRLSVGPLVGLEALSTNPAFGFGVGNKEGVYPYVFGAWQNSGALVRFPHYADLPAEDLMSNGFWWFWIFFGLIGGFIFLLLVAGLLRSAGVDKAWRVLSCTFVVWYAGSAVVDPQSWLIIVVFSTAAVRFSGNPPVRTGGLPFEPSQKLTV